MTRAPKKILFLQSHVIFYTSFMQGSEMQNWKFRESWSMQTSMRAKQARRWEKHVFISIQRPEIWEWRAVSAVLYGGMIMIELPLAFFTACSYNKSVTPVPGRSAVSPYRRCPVSHWFIPGTRSGWWVFLCPLFLASTRQCPQFDNLKIREKASL